jgi:sulfate adenylyltransferase (ADP) / ATP adenylyltransferase
METEVEYLEQAGVRFVVRVAASLARKEAERDTQERRETDPFLPHDPALFVAELTDSHLCLLNKFNVLEHHVLVVTREFEEQESLLTVADLEALWLCLAEVNGLGFYNGGETAGASQHHKHLQLVPLPLGTPDDPVPMAAVLHSVEPPGRIGCVAGLPFRHALARLEPGLQDDPLRAARATHALYRDMLAAVGAPPKSGAEGPRQSLPYNLLLTRSWMLLVPRTRERFQGISVNALGYAGSLFVRDRRQFETVRTHGPMTLLREVSL